MVFSFTFELSILVFQNIASCKQKLVKIFSTFIDENQNQYIFAYM